MVRENDDRAPARHPQLRWLFGGMPAGLGFAVVESAKKDRERRFAFSYALKTELESAAMLSWLAFALRSSHRSRWTACS